MKQEGQFPGDEALKQVWPTRHAHINVYGRYYCNQAQLVKNSHSERYANLGFSLNDQNFPVSKIKLYRQIDMAKKQGSSVLLNLAGLLGGFIAGPILVLLMMSSGQRVGYEGIFYLLVSPFAGAAAGVALCNLPSKGKDFEDLD